VAEFALQIAEFSSMAAGQLETELALPNCRTSRNGTSRPAAPVIRSIS
jgi:hypothetical protein